MTNPVYKIETYTGETLDHTITKDAVSYFKEIVTDGVGHFMFTVPTVKGKPDPYYYDDIALGDKVKIWFGHDSVSGDPDFVGKVGKISAPLSTQSGYLRVISGLSQGEILLRRFKHSKYYSETGASTIVTEWANDIELGTEQIESDTTAVTLEVQTKSYFDLLREISDWYDAGGSIKKDFHVAYCSTHANGDLVWKSRPFRTSGVETLTVGDNIIGYNVIRPIEPVKNDITVYGNFGHIGIPGEDGRTLPTDKDAWTVDDIGNWYAIDGTIALAYSGNRIGSNHLAAYTGAEEFISQWRREWTGSPLNAYGPGKYQTINFWFAVADNCIESKVRILCPNITHSFEADLDMPGSMSGWLFRQFQLGVNQEYDADFNPSGVWTKNGSPKWFNMEGVDFYVEYNNVDRFTHLDGLYFGHGRWRSTVSDNDSITAYGRRELEHIDDKLHSDTECNRKAQTLLYQKKDSPIQLEITTLGNRNILVGDQLPMTISAENISETFDVISAEHSFSSRGFLTKATMVNSVNIREAIELDPLRAISNLTRRMRHLSMNEKGVG